jgi:transcriptional regulator with XRE-family HTH domain
MSNYLRLRRVELGISQSQLSLAGKIPQHRISLLERNRVKPKPGEAETIARILGIKKSDLQKEASITIKEPQDGQ